MHEKQALTFDSKPPEPLQKRPKLLGPKNVEQLGSVEAPSEPQAATVAQTLSVPQLNRDKKRKAEVVDSQAETESEVDTDLEGDGIGSYPLTSQE